MSAVYDEGMEASSDFPRRELDDLADAYRTMELAMLSRFTHGWEEDVFYHGASVGKKQRYDHGGGVRLLTVRKKREDVLNEKQDALEAEAAENKRREGNAQHDTEIARRRIFIDMMTRDRNRNPERWNGSVHIKSGFDLDDWEGWVLEREKERRLWEMQRINAI